MADKFTLNNVQYIKQENGYCFKIDGSLKDRISKAKFEEAKAEYEAKEAAIAEDMAKPAVINEYGCVDCKGCRNTKCVHRDCMRRNPIEVGGLAECKRLENNVAENATGSHEEAKEDNSDTEVVLEHAKEDEAKENKKKASKKPRKSKDIAFEMDLSTGRHITLTAKQADFIAHIPDTYFYENGVDSAIWVDCLADDIGGQFANKPMTVGAMISTLCEKGLGCRGKGKVNGRKATSFEFTEEGKEVAKELGLN